MDWLKSLLTNPFLITGMSSWLVAQVLKMIINAIINKSFSLGWLFSDGGMPSGHSATVSSLAVFTLLQRGPSSFEFAIAMILAIIVCHDATGVRQETGKQAVLLNEIIESFEVLTSKKLPEVKLKEYVGHTPVQVFAGVSLGVAMALCMHFLVFA
ncbi:MAG: divergent PAP2 family protein [Oscillospiraceae bacterium]|jgi:acid phosphatase family membrane protein YuiD|nr:divergent PAP2 family protein [Oscillospiraceae bacterium]